MEKDMQATYIRNTLSYLHLLPEDEQLDKLNKILAYFKKYQQIYYKKTGQHPRYVKLLKRTMHII